MQIKRAMAFIKLCVTYLFPSAFPKTSLAEIFQLSQNILIAVAKM